MESGKLTFRIPTSVGIPQRQAEAAGHAAWPSLYRIVTAGNKVPLGLCVFDVVTCPVRKVRIVLLSSHLSTGTKTLSEIVCGSRSGPVDRWEGGMTGKEKKNSSLECGRGEGRIRKRGWANTPPHLNSWDRCDGLATRMHCQRSGGDLEASFVPGPFGRRMGGPGWPSPRQLKCVVCRLTYRIVPKLRPPSAPQQTGVVR